jgi:hypothetical protein
MKFATYVNALFDVCSSGIKVGYGSMLDIFHGLRKYTPNTALVKSDQNERVLRAAALAFSKVQRLKPVQRDFMWNLANTLIEIYMNTSNSFANGQEWGKRSLGGILMSLYKWNSVIVLKIAVFADLMVVQQMMYGF